MNSNFISGHFIYNNQELSDSPSWNMSLKITNSMRFRWNESNLNRDNFFQNILKNDEKLCPIELIHSKIVYDLKSYDDCFNKKGDGLITINTKLVPTVTVADCVPIFIYEKDSKVFGVLHSGWKGTGIVKEALLLAEKNYNSKIENFSVVIGPHINECCYTVDEERAEYFVKNFCDDCVKKIDTNLYSLSLTKANLACLNSLGIKNDNILVINDCTCCNEKYGSFRRETMNLPSHLSLEEKSKLFTVQAAWIKA